MKIAKLSTSIVLILACTLTLHAQKFKLPRGIVTKKDPVVTSQTAKVALPPKVTVPTVRSGAVYSTFFPIPSFVTNWLKKLKTPAVQAPVTAPTAVSAQTTEQLIEDLKDAMLQRHRAQVSTQQRLDAELDEIEDELLAQDLENDLQNAIHAQHMAQANLSTHLDAELDQAEAELLGQNPLETTVERTAAEQMMPKKEKQEPQVQAQPQLPPEITVPVKRPNLSASQNTQKLDALKHWVQEHQRWPSSKNKAERVMYYWAYGLMREKPNDPVSMELEELKKQYIQDRTPRKTAQEWLNLIEPWVLKHGRWPSPMVEEEKSLYNGAKHTIARWPDDSVGIRLKELKEKYFSARAISASSQGAIQRTGLENALDNAITRQVAKAQQRAVPTVFEQWGMLTGRQALGKYANGWNYELQARYFAKAQIDRIREVFQETDKILFETNEQGHWKKPATSTWQNYTQRFKKTLMANGIRYTSHQMDILFGPNSMLTPVLTRLDVQSFVVFNGRMPSLEATDEAERTLAQQAQALNIKLAPLPEGALKKVESTPQTPAPVQTQAVSVPQKPAVSRKTPQEWLETVESWVLEHQRWPSHSVKEEEALYMNTYFAIRNHPDDPASVRMKELKEKYSIPVNRYQLRQQWLKSIESWVLEHQRWPSQGIKEEKKLYGEAFRIIHNNPNDPVSIRLKALQQQYGATRVHKKSPQEWLEVIEPWVIEHGRWPFSHHPDEKKMYKGAWSAIQSNPTDPASIRLEELKKQYVERQIADPKSPQEWLEIVEPWVLEHGRWPSQYVEEEKQMYRCVHAAMKRNPNDPVSIRLQELQEQYHTRRTPQEWLEMIEPWVLEHQRWPLFSVEEEKQMYIGAKSVLLNHPDDPASIRLKELKEMYK